MQRERRDAGALAELAGATEDAAPDGGIEDAGLMLVRMKAEDLFDKSERVRRDLLKRYRHYGRFEIVT